MISSIVENLVYQLGYLSLLVHKKCSKPAMNKAQNNTIWEVIIPFTKGLNTFFLLKLVDKFLASLLVTDLVSLWWQC